MQLKIRQENGETCQDIFVQMYQNHYHSQNRTSPDSARISGHTMNKKTENGEYSCKLIPQMTGTTEGIEFKLFNSKHENDIVLQP